MELTDLVLLGVITGIVKMAVVRDGQIHEGQQENLRKQDVVIIDRLQKYLPAYYDDAHCKKRLNELK